MRCSTKPFQPRLLPRVLGRALPTQCNPKPATVNQVSTHFTAALNLNLKHLDLAHLPPVGRLKHCLVNWQLFCKDPWVFQPPPHQTRHPHGITHTQAESNLIENEVQDLLTKQAIHPVPLGQGQDGFVSNLFLVP